MGLQYLHRSIKHRCRDSAEPVCLTLLSPGEHYASPLPLTFQNVVNHNQSLHLQDRLGANIKPINVLSTVLPPTPKNSTSQSVQVPELDQIEPSASVYESTPFVLPDPGRPPADQDNTSIWEAVMAKKEKTTKSEAKPPTLAESAGARGTSGYEFFLVKLLGKALDVCVEFPVRLSPDTHFGHNQGTLSVRKYVNTYSGEEAGEFAEAIQSFTEFAHTEADLCNAFIETIFRSEINSWPRTRSKNRMTFSQEAIVRRAEYTSNFHGYDASELRRGLADIRHIRLSPQDRLQGRSTADTPNLLPAETDLRGRCDIVFGIYENCMESHGRDLGTFVPCHDPSAGVCAIWLRVEFKKTNEQRLIQAARHQWAAGAYLELQARVRLARGPRSEPYLSNPSSTKDLRQYGYVICGGHVEIWEMLVEASISAQEGNRRETWYPGDFFQFPASKLAGLHLDDAEGVEQFCHWHEKIMDWGFNVYSRQYLDNIAHLYQENVQFKDWTLDYDKAIGRKIPSLPEEEQDTEPTDIPTTVNSATLNHLTKNTGPAEFSAQPVNTPIPTASESLNLLNEPVEAATSGEHANTSRFTVEQGRSTGQMKSSSEPIQAQGDHTDIIPNGGQPSSSSSRPSPKIDGEGKEFSSSGSLSGTRKNIASSSISSEPENDKEAGRQFSNNISGNLNVNGGTAEPLESVTSESLADKTPKTKSRKRNWGSSTGHAKGPSKSELPSRSRPREPKAKLKQSNLNGVHIQPPRSPSHVKPTILNTTKVQGHKGSEDEVFKTSASQASTLQMYTKKGKRRCQAWQASKEQCPEAAKDGRPSCGRSSHEKQVGGHL